MASASATEPIEGGWGVTKDLIVYDVMENFVPLHLMTTTHFHRVPRATQPVQNRDDHDETFAFKGGYLLPRRHFFTNLVHLTLTRKC